MIYMRNITITTAKSATYLENVGLNQRLLGLADGLFDRVNLLGDIKAGSARLNHFDDPLEMAVGALQALDDFRVRFMDVWILAHANILSPRRGYGN